jgi:hypothetical protein
LVKEAQSLSGKENRACKIPALRKVAGLDRAKEKLRAATRSWAACLARVFEVEPLKCPRCSGELVPVAAILADRELERLLAYLELPTELPKTAPARSPPFSFEEAGPESDRGITRGSVASEGCWEATQVSSRAVAPWSVNGRGPGFHRPL